MKIVSAKLGRRRMRILSRRGRRKWKNSANGKNMLSESKRKIIGAGYRSLRKDPDSYGKIISAFSRSVRKSPGILSIPIRKRMVITTMTTMID